MGYHSFILPFTFALAKPSLSGKRLFIAGYNSSTAPLDRVRCVAVCLADWRQHPNWSAQ